ncbi:MAG: response regulator [Bacilli bacterium]
MDIDYAGISVIIEKLINSYYHNRDLETFLTCVTDDISYFGTEKDEEVFGKENLRKLLEKDISAFPDSFDISLEEPKIKAYSEDHVMVTVIGKQESIPFVICGFSIRATVSIIRENGIWLVDNIHISVPNSEMEKFTLETQLAAEKAKEVLLLDKLPGGISIIHVMKDGRLPLEYISEGLTQISGYTTKEFLDLYGDDSSQCISERDKNKLFDFLSKIDIAKDNQIKYDFHVISKQGKEVHLNLRASIIAPKDNNPDELCVLYAVQTSLSNEEKKIMAVQERNSFIIRHIWIALYDWQEDLGFYYSEAFSKYAFSQYSVEDLLDDSILTKVIYPDDLPLIGEYQLDSSKNERSRSYTARMLMIDGTYRWTEVSAYQLYNEEGKLIRSMRTFRDVEERWEEKNNALRKALDEARSANKTKNEFFARMSHDMRTPLNGIMGSVSLALDNPNLPTDIKENLEDISFSAKFLYTLISDLLDFSKLESNDMVLYPEPYHYYEFVHNMTTMIEPLCREKNISLDMGVIPNLNIAIMVDKLRFQQIFFNIFSNAVKYTPEGGHIRHYTVINPIDKTHAECTCHIVDDGIGMGKEFQKHLFEKYKVERINDDSVQSTGLGLSIVAQLVKLMKGDIAIKSEPGKGTDVSIHFVLDVITTDFVQPKDKKPISGFEAMAGKRVLLFEDHPLNAKIATKILSKWGVSVDHAENGEVGLTMFEQSAPHYYDFILMDIRMPIMNGLEATKEIRSLDREDSKNIPILAMTANAYPEDINASLAAGMNAHIAKPINPETLYNELMKFFK